MSIDRGCITELMFAQQGDRKLNMLMKRRSELPCFLEVASVLLLLL